MAVVTGNAGAVAMTGTTGATLDTNVTSWSADVSSDLHDTTAFGVTGNTRVGIQGLISMAGSFEGLLDSSVAISITDITTPLAAGSNGTLTLTASSGRTYSCKAVFSGISVSSSIGELNKISASFQSDGAITVA